MIKLISLLKESSRIKEMSLENPSAKNFISYLGSDDKQLQDFVSHFGFPAKTNIEDIKDYLLGIDHTDPDWVDFLSWMQKKRGNSIDEAAELKQAIQYVKPNFEYEWEEAKRYPEFVKMGKTEWIKLAKKGYVTDYSKIKRVLGNVDLKFNKLEKSKKDRFETAFEKGKIEHPIAVKFSDDDYDLVAGNTRLSGLVANGIDPKLWVVDISKKQKK